MDLRFLTKADASFRVPCFRPKVLFLFLVPSGIPHFYVYTACISSAPLGGQFLGQALLRVMVTVSSDGQFPGVLSDLLQNVHLTIRLGLWVLGGQGCRGRVLFSSQPVEGPHQQRDLPRSTLTSVIWWKPCFPGSFCEMTPFTWTLATVLWSILS